MAKVSMFFGNLEWIQSRSWENLLRIECFNLLWSIENRETVLVRSDADEILFIVLLNTWEVVAYSQTI